MILRSPCGWTAFIALFGSIDAFKNLAALAIISPPVRRWAEVNAFRRHVECRVRPSHQGWGLHTIHPLRSAAISALCFSGRDPQRHEKQRRALSNGDAHSSYGIIVEHEAICITFAERVARWGVSILDWLSGSTRTDRGENNARQNRLAAEGGPCFQSTRSRALVWFSGCRCQDCGPPAQPVRPTSNSAAETIITAAARDALSRFGGRWTPAATCVW